MVHGSVGISKKHFLGGSIGRISGNTNAERHKHFLFFQHVRQRRLFEDPVGNLGRILLTTEAGEQYGKLIPPQTRHDLSGFFRCRAR